MTISTRKMIFSKYKIKFKALPTFTSFIVNNTQIFTQVSSYKLRNVTSEKKQVLRGHY